jgi:threonine/homoserine/homoserine lactone efflux protein
VVILTPGPAVLAFLGLGAMQGRLAGALFVTGHLVGDLLWATLAIVALVWTRALDPWVFVALAGTCGLYLGYLGLRAMLSKSAAATAVALGTRRPLLRGFAFGLTNPKSYPVTLAIFAALLGGSIERIDAAEAAVLLAAAFGGFVIGDVILVWLVGTPWLLRLYKTHQLWIMRATGALFLFFAGDALLLAYDSAVN